MEDIISYEKHLENITSRNDGFILNDCMSYNNIERYDTKTNIQCPECDGILWKDTFITKCTIPSNSGPMFKNDAYCKKCGWMGEV